MLSEGPEGAPGTHAHSWSHRTGCQVSLWLPQGHNFTQNTDAGLGNCRSLLGVTEALNSKGKLSKRFQGSAMGRLV